MIMRHHYRTVARNVDPHPYAMTPPWGSDVAWQQDALCAQVDPEAFFPTRGPGCHNQIQQAKATCRRCPVVAECLAYALRHEEIFGIWGGKSEFERRKLRESA